jgi:hypothetical protein
MNLIDISSISRIFSGSTIVRERTDSRAVMVGDLDGTGILPKVLTSVGAPPSGAASALRTGDVVISLRGNSNNAASVADADHCGVPLFATLDLAVIRVDDAERINPQYLATWLNLPATQAVLAEGREGSAAKRLPLGPLKALRIPLPDKTRQQAIVELAQMAVEERCTAMRIADLRATLINQCLVAASIRPLEETNP